MNLCHWTSYLDSQNYPTLPVTPEVDKCYILLEAQVPEDEDDFLTQSFSVPDKKTVKVKSGYIYSERESLRSSTFHSG